jgi:hypothetical protein
MPRLYHVQTTLGPIDLYALTQSQAISTALELAGPGSGCGGKGNGDT